MCSLLQHVSTCVRRGLPNVIPHHGHRSFFFRKKPNVLYQAKTEFNQISVVEFPDNHQPKSLARARVMLLDGTGNIHSTWRSGPTKPTMSYWDILATLPGISPPGTMGVLGLGAGTLAHLVAAYHPGRRMEAWELDPAVIMAARKHMGLSALESDGLLQVHVGDALSPSATVPDGMACIAVDIFSHGALPNALTQPNTWQCIKDKLAAVPGARIMVNLGQAVVNSAAGSPLQTHVSATQQALDAMLEVFGEGQVSTMELVDIEEDGGTDSTGSGSISPESANCIALTGPHEGLQHQWAASLPDELKHLAGMGVWRAFDGSASPLKL